MEKLTLAVAKATAVCAEFEGLRLHRYKCPAGVDTIGYGHTGGKIPASCTQKQANLWLHQDVVEAMKSIPAAQIEKMNANQIAAVTSFVFNIGGTRFKSSTLLKKLIAEDYAGAAREFGKWVYAKNEKLNGLVIRREAERDLFNCERELS